jgi:hypothetical protein
MSLVGQVDLLLINGPGTCVPVALCHFITRGWRQIIYVESICRYIQKISASYKLVLVKENITLLCGFGCILCRFPI